MYVCVYVCTVYIYTYAFKLINGYKTYSYGERLVWCRLISLEKRRVKGHLIEMFKMSKNNDLFNSMFKLRRSESLRGNKRLLFLKLNENLI